MRGRDRLWILLALVACFAEEGGGGSASETNASASDETSAGSVTTSTSTTVGTTVADDTGDSGDTTDTGPTCAEGSACVAVPEGWSGPVAVLEGEGGCDGGPPAFV